MGYGVIGNTKVSGSFVLGSSPGIPASLHMEVAAPSYSGLVLRPLTAATPVQIRLGSLLGKKLSSRKTGELLCLSDEKWFEILWCRHESLTAPLLTSRHSGA